MLCVTIECIGYICFIFLSICELTFKSCRYFLNILKHVIDKSCKFFSICKKKNLVPHLLYLKYFFEYFQTE